MVRLDTMVHGISPLEKRNLDCKVYGSADFNDEGLMTTLTHYADFGATMMQILPEEVVAQMMGGK